MIMGLSGNDIENVDDVVGSRWPRDGGNGSIIVLSGRYEHNVSQNE